MRRFFLVVVVVMLALGGGAAQQRRADPATPDTPSVTFRAETNFVEVHAIVTDTNGAFVRDLDKDDFEIYENGVRQQPALFSLIDLPIQQPRTGPDGGPLESDVRTTTRTFDGRIYVLLLDDLHTSVTRTPLVRQTARRFIERYLGVTDLAAVVFTSGRSEAGQELTGSRRLLLAAVDRFQGQKLPSAGSERLAVHLRDAAAQDQQQRVRTTEGLDRAGDARDPLDQRRAFTARQALDAVENVAGWLADVQGRRKGLLLFSEGIDYDIYQPFAAGGSSGSLVADARQAIAAAQRANVNIYGVDPRGLNQLSGLMDVNARSDYPQLAYAGLTGELRELLLAQESLISLADETGGLAVVNANDVAGGLARIVLDNSRYYLLGYYSDSSKWSGQFMKIDVKVKRPGLRVRARRGYLPPDRSRAARVRESDIQTGTSPALRAALGRPVPVGDLPIRAFAAAFKGDRSSASVLIAVEIDGASLTFGERDGRFVERLEVSIVATDHRGKVQGGDRQTFDLRLMPQSLERVRAGGVRLLSRLDLPPARYQIRIGAFETGGATVSAVPYDLDVPDLAQTSWAMSGMVLTSSVADALVTANPDPRLAGILPGPPVVRRAFSSRETLTAAVEVYDNGRSRTGQAAECATTVREIATGTIVSESRERRSSDGTTGPLQNRCRTEVSLGGLLPGEYLLRVTATDAADAARSASREVLFEVR